MIRFARHGAPAFSRIGAAARDQRGAFAVAFALMIPVLILVIGLGIDFLSDVSFKARWDAAADAAALAADQTASAYAKANAANYSASQLIVNAKAAGVAAGIKAFNASAGVSEVTGSVTPSIVVTNQSTQFTATVSYAGSMPTQFGSFIGIGSFAIQGQAVASTSLTTYINYYILIDNSQSMGIGATQTDMINLYAQTKQMGYTDNGEPGCVFGCHVATYGRPLNNEQVAHNNGLTLRIDAAKTAVQDVINQAQALSTANNIQIGLYTIQANPISNSDSAVTIASPTGNFANLTAALQTVDLGSNTTQGLGDSNMTNSLQNFAANVLPSNGTGYSASSPLNYVFVVTDGLLDTYAPCNFYWHCTGVMGSSDCATMQQKSTVGVIYTTYLPIYKNNDSTQGYDTDYAALVQPYQSQILPSLQSCASTSSYFFQADDGPALIAAMQQLFASTAATIRLTQ